MLELEAEWLQCAGEEGHTGGERLSCDLAARLLLKSIGSHVISAPLVVHGLQAHLVQALPTLVQAPLVVVQALPTRRTGQAPQVVQAPRVVRRVARVGRR